MTTFRLAAAALAVGFAAAPAAADDYVTYEHLDVTLAAAPDCRNSGLVSLPSSWRSGDGAVVLVTREPLLDAARDQLVAVLLDQRAAVFEFMPVPCGPIAAGRDAVAAGALGALDAITRVTGAGPVVAIGYGRDSAAVLDVVGMRMAGGAGEGGPRYVGAVAIGAGAPGFARDAGRRDGDDVPLRLAALCDALAAWAGHMGATEERAMPAATAEGCHAGMAEGRPEARAARR
ncbi:hypothetical protein J5Y09_10225 [Roseomonas sp. PWR1]|uniref:Alpha/beta hydrolase n=1 Tax=Roseomonas nitratireducens TaxID=2820810 RepID=A0ABS4ASF3_9PROT|nr:hypothetical protein [Neoroseomonas nitratireducens]MBP0464290.1 hypothetical protein [Neoroseomonas nitratireducens]